MPDPDRFGHPASGSSASITWGDDTDNGGHSFGGRWCPLGADGSTAEYERVVDELWGPRPLHMLSVVSPQKPVSLRVRGDDGEAITVTTDLASASRGMLRALLRQLLGLGAYQAASRKAHETANGEDRAMEADNNVRCARSTSTTPTAWTQPKEWQPGAAWSPRTPRSPNGMPNTR